MDMTNTDAAASLREGDTSVDLTDAVITVVDAHDEALGVFMARYNDTALAAAAKADAELAAGSDRDPLHGIPLGIKDIIAADEGETTRRAWCSTARGARWATRPWWPGHRSTRQSPRGSRPSSSRVCLGCVDPTLACLLGHADHLPVSGLDHLLETGSVSVP
jgi:hypothetical protein